MITICLSVLAHSCYLRAERQTIVRDDDTEMTGPELPMTMLTPDGQAIVNDVANRHGFSPQAVTELLVALEQGGGTQAQFNHWEFGGMGQWSLGGMVMIGDMFNNGLKARVDSLCTELSNVLANTMVFRPAQVQNQSSSYQGQMQGGGQMQMQGGGGMGQSSLFVPGSGMGNWWPAELGQPGSTGAQNDMKYAYFPNTCRLAILVNGQTTVYDTGAHQIGGFGQQQSGDQSLTFTSQFGLVRVADLPVVQMGPDVPVAQPEPAPVQPEPQPEPQQTIAPEPAAPAPQLTSQPAPMGGDSDAIFAALEKLGALRDMGILSDQEFSDKKAELLARL